MPPGTVTHRVRARLTALLPAMFVPPAIAAGLLALFRGDGFPNYDTEYALVWGRALADGHAPDTSAYLSPTPHPLADLVGTLLALVDPASGSAPYGTASESLVTAGGFLWLGVLGFLVFRLGQRWAGPAAGVVAAAIVLTREPVLSFGVRSYVDIPYVCLVLGALLRESRRPRDGVGTLVLLALAGLLRPEAWLFAAAYLVYLWWPQRWATPRLPLLVALAAAGPVLWALHDLLITGDPLYSLTGTRENADTLRRVTGFDDLPVTGARRLGEITREPVLLGAVIGLAFAVTRLRTRHAVRAGLLTLVAAGLAFALLAGAGLPIITRYLLLPGVLLAVLAAVALTGFTQLEPGATATARRAAYAGAVAVAATMLAFAPGQHDRIDRLRNAITTQTVILRDLRDLTEGGVGDDGDFVRDGYAAARGLPCAPIAVPNQRAVPQLALWLDLQPSDVVVSQRSGVPARGTYIRPADATVARRFVLDPRDADKAIPAPAAGSSAGAANASWETFARCG